jgi:hypothetical protein
MEEEKNYKMVAIGLPELKEICRENSFWLAGEEMSFMPFALDPALDILVRYVRDEGYFGYASMGDFFFCGDCMYVTTNEDWINDCYNEDIAEIFQAEYGIEFKRPNQKFTRVFYAGIATPFKDEQGDWVFTGDLVHVKYFFGDELQQYGKGKGNRAKPTLEVRGRCSEDPELFGAVAPIKDLRQRKGEATPKYGIVLDNDYITLSQCTRIDRIGTLMFKINPSQEEFWPDFVDPTSDGYSRKFLNMARHTPSFEQEDSKYTILESLDIEYNWRK